MLGAIVVDPFAAALLGIAASRLLRAPRRLGPHHVAAVATPLAMLPWGRLAGHYGSTIMVALTILAASLWVLCIVRAVRRRNQDRVRRH